jgi:DNA recombination protein RmuC
LSEVVYTLLGLLVGAVAVVVVVALLRRREGELIRHFVDETEKEKAAELSVVIEQLKTAFKALSYEALSSNADEFLKLAKTRLEKQTTEGEQALEAKKRLIDARLEEMATKLTSLNSLMQAIERQRAEAHGVLTGQLERATKATDRLHDTTAQLREALASPQRRGQWGERMAEDVLRLAGFVEGINYVKQQRVAEGTRPDFTFLLPDERRIHMDVKFPLANYLKMLDARDDRAREDGTKQFLQDVRARVKEVTTRDYIDPASGTVDYVLVFIPNEQVYAFIHDRDSSLLDDAMRCKVVLCSPMTLYAILAVVRQAVDNFHLEQGSKQILELLGEFKKQWGKFVEQMERMGKRLDDAHDDYQQLVGVRTRQLDRQLDKIDDLRAAREEQTPPGLPASQESEGAT